MIPPAPTLPPIHPVACGENVCLTVADAKAVANYTHGMKEVEIALEGCNLVERK